MISTMSLPSSSAAAASLAVVAAAAAAGTADTGPTAVLLPRNEGPLSFAPPPPLFFGVAFVLGATFLGADFSGATFLGAAFVGATFLVVRSPIIHGVPWGWRWRREMAEPPSLLKVSILLLLDGRLLLLLRGAAAAIFVLSADFSFLAGGVCATLDRPSSVLGCSVIVRA